MTDSIVRNARPDRERVGHGGVQWYGILVPPVAMLVFVGLGYSLVPWSCSDRSQLPLHAAAIVLALIAVSGLLAGRQQWRQGGGNTRDSGAGDDRRDEAARARFMGAMGIASGTLFSLSILAQWLATVFLHPCWGS